MKRIAKRGMCFIMCILMMLTAFACGKGENKDIGTALPDELNAEGGAEGYYQILTEIQTGMNVIKDVFVGEDSNIYLYNANGNELKIVSTDKDGNIIREIVCNIPEKCSVSNVGADADGNIFYRQQVGTGEEINLIKLSSTGEEIGNLSLEPNEEDVTKIFTLCGDKVANIVDQELTLYDKDFNNIANIEVPTTVRSMVYRDGYLYIVYADQNAEDYEASLMEKIDVDSAEVVEKDICMPCVTANLSVGKVYDFSYQISSSIRGFNIGENTENTIFDREISGISGTLSCAAEIDNTHIVAVLSSSSAEAEKAYILEKSVKEKQNKEKQNKGEKVTITIGGCGFNDSIKDALLEYNNSQDDCEVVVIDYLDNTSEFDGGVSSTDFYNGMDNMNMDIISGNVPDIIYFTGRFGSVAKTYENNYISKKLFTDLLPLMEEDGDIKKEDFLDNIIKIHEHNGKVYTLPLGFEINAYCTTESMYNDLNGDVSLNNLEAFESMVSGKILESWNNKNRVLEQILLFNSSRFYDSAEGTCNFNSDEFVKLLEYANTYPDDFGSGTSGLGIDGVKNRECGIVYCPIATFRQFNRVEKQFGENVACIGIPSNNGICNPISERNIFGITEASENKEAAWDFIKQFFNEDWQVSGEEENTRGFAVTKAALDRQAAEQQKPATIIDSSTGEEISADTMGGGEGGNERVSVDPISAERAEYLKSVLNSTTDLYIQDDEVFNIVEEEAGAFFAGNKSAEECADIIQERVKNYISEKQ